MSAPTAALKVSYAPSSELLWTAAIVPAAASPNSVTISPGSITITSMPKPRSSKRNASE